MVFSLQQIADYINARLTGQGELEVNAVAPIDDASAGSISFIYDKKYLKHLQSTSATAVILTEDLLEYSPVPCLVVENPRAEYARVVSMLYPAPVNEAGVHESAVVSGEAVIDPTASIAENCVIEAGATIGARVRLEPGVVIGRNSRIGDACHIYANATVYYGCTIGKNCIIHSSAVIGSDGFGFEFDNGQWLKIPQVGGVIIGDNVEIGACSVVDRGALRDTLIEDGVKLDNHVQIAHNVVVGENTIMSRGVGVAGSTRIGRNCIFAGMTGVKDHIEITDNVTVTAMSMVSRSLKNPGSYSSNTPIDETTKWRKNSARFRQLDELAKKIRQLEKKLEDKD